MATEKQRAAARKNIRKAIAAAKKDRTIAHMPKAERTALGKEGAAIARRNRTGAKGPLTREQQGSPAQAHPRALQDGPRRARPRPRQGVTCTT